MSELFERLLVACSGGSGDGGLRVTATYEPVGGKTTKVFPPTYAVDGKYIEESRYVDGVVHRAIVLDAVQSQANRFEVAVLDATELDGLGVPYLSVAADIDGESFRLTSLEAPHRSTDAYFRDAQTPEGVAFDDSPVGAALLRSDADNARPLFMYSPVDLVLGVWNSQRRKRGIRLPRAYTSEIVAFDPERGRRSGGRLDPYNLQAGEVFYDADDPAMWSTDKTDVANAKKGKASNINHGNALASDAPGGFAVDRIERVAVLSLAVLRRLRFPGRDGASREIDAAARAVLASLALVGDRLAFAGSSLFLRSGCDLVLVDERVEWVGRGAARDAIDLDENAARALFDEAKDHAASLGVRFADGPLELEPKANLRQLLTLNFAAPAADTE